MSFLDEALTRHFQAKRSVKPQAMNRASQAGIECARRLQWHRTKWEKAALPDDGLQRRFELGHIFEPAIVRALEDAGVEVQQRQRDLSWPELQVSGHIDGLVSEPESAELAVLEIKSCSTFAFERIRKCHTAQDLLKLGGYIAGYVSQTATYLLLMSLKNGYVLFVNKDNFQTHTIVVTLLDAEILDLAEKTIKRWERVNAAIKAGEDLPPEPAEYCQKCPFVAACMPDQVWDSKVELLDDEEIAGLLARREELAPTVSEFEEVDNALKARFDKPGDTLVGNFLVRVKEHLKTVFNVPEDVKQQYASKVAQQRRTYSRIEKQASVAKVPTHPDKEAK